MKSANEVKSSEPKYRQMIRGKFRIYVGWISVLVVLALSNKEPYWLGLVVGFMGVYMRAWAAGYIHKDQQLANSGPYALCRNPLYFGSYLLVIGISVMIKSIPAFIILSAMFLTLYNFIIEDEEKKLIVLFGKPYEGYISSVPRFFPTISSMISTIRSASGNFSFGQMMKNQEYNSLIGLIAVFIILLLKHLYLNPYIYN